MKQSLTLTGPVQGIGLRPFCLRLATEHGVKGWICNQGGEVAVELQAEPSQIEAFVQGLRHWLPATANCEAHRPEAITELEYEVFSIQHQTFEQLRCQVNPVLSPDKVPCQRCLAEMRDPDNRRYGYSFITCADCGPRASISHQAPFERRSTSMHRFKLCYACQQEYDNPEDRRFYTQTITCPQCGPRLILRDQDGGIIIGQSRHQQDDEIYAQLIACLRAGGVVAVKGNCGFHLLVDPNHAAAVQRLRELKLRPYKPLALMYPDIQSVEQDCELNEPERECLTSSAGPIVLLSAAAGREKLLQTVAPGIDRLGVMLPSSAIYHRLMAQWRGPLVVSSGNRAGYPLVSTYGQLLQQFASELDLVLDHDLQIVDAQDDSIVQLIAGKTQVLRPGRGFCPQQFDVPVADKPVLAQGALLKNTVAYAEQGKLSLSRYLGDLDHEPVQTLQQQQIDYLLPTPAPQSLYVAQDLHPDFQFAALPNALADATITNQQVPHHLAHALSVEVEHGLQPPYLAVTWDGLGFGADSGLWGSEFLVIKEHGYERLASLKPMPFVGGEQAFREPRLMAVSLLSEAANSYPEPASQLRRWLRNQPNSPGWNAEQQRWLEVTLEGRQALPETTSMGRLFDAVASMLGVCHVNSYEAEAAMRLQALVAWQGKRLALTTGATLPLPLRREQNGFELDWLPMIAAMAGRLRGNEVQQQKRLLVIDFIEALVQGIAQVATQAGLKQVALSGGCFQNPMLLQRSCEHLKLLGFQPYWPQRIPVNDSGIAAGQVMALIKQQRV